MEDITRRLQNVGKEQWDAWTGVTWTCRVEHTWKKRSETVEHTCRIHSETDKKKLRFLGLAPTPVVKKKEFYRSCQITLTFNSGDVSPDDTLMSVKIEGAELASLTAMSGADRTLGGVPPLAVSESARENPTLRLTEEQALVLGARPAAPREHQDPHMPTPKRVHPTARLLLLGSADPHSSLCTLGGHSDELQLIFEACEEAWRGCYDTTEDGTVAFEHVPGRSSSARSHFPPLVPAPLDVNMMPFVLGEVESLPESCRRYWDLIHECAETLPADARARTAYVARPQLCSICVATMHRALAMSLQVPDGDGGACGRADVASAAGAAHGGLLRRRARAAPAGRPLPRGAAVAPLGDGRVHAGRRV